MKFSKLKYLFLASLISSLSVAMEGSGHSGGGGAAEKNVVFAYLNLGKYIDLCIASETCHLTPVEKDWLSQIRRGLKTEGTPEKELVFRSEKQEPGTFQIDGFERMAKTGYAANDTIYVNLDLLYTTDGGQTKPLSLADAVAMLVHELGHHQGIKSHTALDALGSKVETQLVTHTQQLDGMIFGGWEPRITMALVFDAYAFSDSFRHPGMTQVLVADDYGIYDITDTIRKQIACPKVGGTPVRADIANLHFTRRGEVLGDYLYRYDLQGQLDLVCEGGYISGDRYDVRFHVTTKQEPGVEGFGYKFVSIATDIIDCATPHGTGINPECH